MWCRVDLQPVHCLDSGNGSLRVKLRNVDEIIESPYSELALRSRRRTSYLLVERTNKTIPRITPAMSDAAFSSDALCLAEYSGPVRCIDCETGNERWRYVPPKGFHVIEISYQADQSFYGLLFGFGSPEAALLRFSPDHGACTEICRYDLSKRYGGGFGDGVFVAATGEVLSLIDGEVIRQLAFPQSNN